MKFVTLFFALNGAMLANARINHEGFFDDVGTFFSSTIPGCTYRFI